MSVINLSVIAINLSFHLSSLKDMDLLILLTVNAVEKAGKIKNEIHIVAIL